MAGRQQTYIQSGRTATEAESRRSDERRPDEHVQKEEGPDRIKQTLRQIFSDTIGPEKA